MSYCFRMVEGMHAPDARVGVLVVSFIVATFMSLSAGAQGTTLASGVDRVALVIGNGNYVHASGLRNPVNDAQAVAATLRALDFDVIYQQDAALESMLDALREFMLRSRNASVRVLYYAGHGTQLKGKNYLIPIDATFDDEEEVPLKTANATQLVDRLGRENGINIVILDACRSKPFPIGRRTRGLSETRSLPKGLAEVVAPAGPGGTLIAFSTAPGGVALDGGEGNSVYTRHLIANMQIAGLPVELLFKRVRISVSEETKLAQIPWESNSLGRDFCFRAGAAGECSLSDTALKAAPAFNVVGQTKR